MFSVHHVEADPLILFSWEETQMKRRKLLLISVTTGALGVLIALSFLLVLGLRLDQSASEVEAAGGNR
jgi:hypothetical protein